MIDSVMLPVCVRCSSIYLGSFIGSLIPVLIGRVLKKNFIVSVWIIYFPAILMMIDVGLNFFHLKEPSWGTKIFTGSVFGIGIGWFLTLQLLKTKRFMKD